MTGTGVQVKRPARWKGGGVQWTTAIIPETPAGWKTGAPGARFHRTAGAIDASDA
jgi:hypothetical protein